MALMLGVILWVFLMLGGESILIDTSHFAEYLCRVVGGDYSSWISHSALLHHLGEISEIVFFLLGAMTIVEFVDSHEGFAVITDKIKTTKKTKMLWILMMIKPVIQVAGVQSLEEALMIASSGATHIGFPFRLDFHSEDTTEEEATRIIFNLPPSVKPVLITYLNDAREIYGLMKKLGCSIVQLHGKVTNKEIMNLKRIDPKVGIWKSLVINPLKHDDAFLTLKALEPVVDAFITDTFDPDTGASGATGKTHDWEVSRNIVLKSTKPVIIAGGLTPNNVYDCIRITKPAGVDVHTGVEGVDGLKRKDLMESFVKNANKAYGVTWTSPRIVALRGRQNQTR